ncbi:MAG: CheR family methyltransferase, partial [Opitutales bacterium]
PVQDLPKKILAYLKRMPPMAKAQQLLSEKARSSLEKAVILLRARTGQDFSLYKSETLYRRIERRMNIHQIDKTASYVRYLQENSQELDLLFKELLIGVTNFFRDPAVWERLRDQAIPELLAQGLPGGILRAWVPGCSTGEEAYSIAMVFKEAVEMVKPKANYALQLFATDLDDDAINIARQGVFPKNIAADVSPERLNRFFTKEEHKYRVRKGIRDMVTFASQNLLMDPPFTKLSLLSCRNLLIYLRPECQNNLIPLFHYSLNPGGVLCIGAAETINGFRDLFSPLEGGLRLFRRGARATRYPSPEFPSFLNSRRSGGLVERGEDIPPLTLQSAADSFVLQHSVWPTALVTDKGDIVYARGRTGKYLEPSSGKANWNIFAMAREGLRLELPGAFRKALANKETVTLRRVKVGDGEGAHFADVVVQNVQDAGLLHGLVMIAFFDVAPPMEMSVASRSDHKTSRRPTQAVQWERDLQAAREDARTMREAMQTWQEEERSANEELQSANEELQSANEELTTSQEEMQSLNEELQTVNAELQSKLDELSRASNDIKNLLNSTDIATLFLDSDLKVRRFTTQVTTIIKLIPADVGRDIMDLASDLDYATLAEDARAVLQSLVSMEKQVSTKDGRWFTIRIMPYRTLDDRIDGLVITFADITLAKTLEAQLRKQHASDQRQISEGNNHAR